VQAALPRVSIVRLASQLMLRQASLSRWKAGSALPQLAWAHLNAVEAILPPCEPRAAFHASDREARVRAPSSGPPPRAKTAASASPLWCHHRLPAMWYSPLTDSWEKRPDLSSPTRMAPFSLAAFLAFSSSEVGLTIVSSWYVFATIYFLPCRGNTPTTRPCVPPGRYTPPPLSTSWS
jgi:hypothetical protein